MNTSDSHSTNPSQLLPTTLLIELTQQTLLSVDGPDAAKFLQGQVTCDIRELATHNTLLGAQCTPKGRMLISFRALQLDPERIVLRLQRNLLTIATASLGKYIVFSKAKLNDLSDTYQGFGLQGSSAKALITELLGVVPNSEQDAWTPANSHIIITLTHERYELWLDSAHAKTIRAGLLSACTLASENDWVLANIRAGIAEIDAQTSELFTPQTINYQLVNGISFRKGCYTGQEIVARLHYRATLKRHMYRLSYPSDAHEPLPLSGSTLVNAQQETIGEIIMAARASTQTIEVLASVQDAQVEQAFTPSEPAKKLELLTLPYAIPTEEKAD